MNVIAVIRFYLLSFIIHTFCAKCLFVANQRHTIVVKVTQNLGNFVLADLDTDTLQSVVKFIAINRPAAIYVKKVEYLPERCMVNDN